MNCFSIMLLTLVSVFNMEADSFVTFHKEDITITQDKDIRVIILPFEIKDGYHIQSNKPNSSGLIVTEIGFESNDQAQIISTSFTGNYKELQLGAEKLKVLYGIFNVTTVVKSTSKTSSHSLKGSLLFQTCDRKKCYFPRELTFEISI